MPSGTANINSSQHISLAAIFEGKHISLVMCFPGRETQNTEAMYTRHLIRVYLLSTSQYCHLLQLFSCHPLKEYYKKISILCNIRNNLEGRGVGETHITGRHI